MPTTQTSSAQAEIINLNDHEMPILRYIQKGRRGTSTCKLCWEEFDEMMSLVVHLLMKCRYSCSTFSTKSAIRICVVLNEPGSVEMLRLYNRVAGEEPESEVSDVDMDTESEVSEDEEFSATPPAFLSSDKQLEWTYRRDRKCSPFSVLVALARDHTLTLMIGAELIRHLKKTNLRPNTKYIDRDAVLAAWNSLSHPSSWAPNATEAGNYKTYNVLATTYATGDEYCFICGFR